jgi:hypothetical protein
VVTHTTEQGDSRRDNRRSTKRARRCTNPECEYGGRWIVGRMVVLRNGRFLCRGRGCHSIYDAAEVIAPENEDYGLYVR